MKRSLLTLSFAALTALPLGSTMAETPAPPAADLTAPTSTLTPADAAWGLIFDPAKVRSSALTSHVMDHFDDAQRASLNEKIDGLSNMLGLNLRQDLGTIVAFGQSFAPQDIGVAVDVGAAQTNLEGLLLADANYDSYEYTDLIIHSVRGEPDKPRLFCAVLPGSELRDGVVLLSPSKTNTEKLVDQVRGGANVADAAALQPQEFLRLWVSRIPQDIFANNPRQSNIAGLIQSLELVGSTGDDDTALTLNLTMGNPARARQIYQMAAGGKALIELAAGSDPDAAKLADLLAYISVKQDAGSALVSITALCDTTGLASVLDMLDEAGAFDELGLE